MPPVTIKSLNKTIDVPAGKELLNSLAEANIDIETPCGGTGTCGKCIVKISAGKVHSDSIGILSAKAIEQGYVLACQVQLLDCPITIEMPEQIEKLGELFVEADDDFFLIHQELFIKESRVDPSVKKILLTVPPPQQEDGLSDLDRLTREIQQQSGKKDVICALSTLRTLAENIRQENGRITVSLLEASGQLHITRVEAGNQSEAHYGVAIDVGTTTVAVQVVSLQDGRVLATKTAYNEQISCGADVISRINYALKPDHLDELQSRILQTINNLINLLCESYAIDGNSISSAVVAGNTTMIHLLLGLKPEYIRLAPYTPTIRDVPYLKAGEAGIAIHPESWLYFSPCVGSYVGGDITSGLLCTDLAKDKEDINLFIDIGTNGELVLGNRDFLMTCACSAGPAFEGGGIEYGMRAVPGAIDDISIDPVTGSAVYRTIGNVKPKGICGSGMITLLANLFLTGWLDAAGKLNREKSSPAIKVDGRRAFYTIVPANASDIEEPIIISENDIENTIRAKAAIYSASSLMLEQVGLHFEDLAHIYIAGGFGRYLDIDKAMAIGLIPDLPKERYHYIGNASLTGAYMVLLSQEIRQRQLEIAKKMTYIELNTEPNYMDQYMGAMFLPHTDVSRFPSVARYQ